MVTCLLVWSLLAAHSLERSARAAPLGTRRTVALAVIRPLSRLSTVLGFGFVSRLGERALGRDPGNTPSGPQEAAGPSLPRAIERPGPNGNLRPPGGLLPPLRRPTRADPLRLLVVGDSLAQDLAIGLERTLDPDRFALTVETRNSTGLARSDYFDWSAEIHRDLDRYRPEVVVAMFGGNDNQDVAVPEGGYIRKWDSRRWQVAYAGRVGDLMEAVTREGSRLLWVGLPITQSSVIPPSRVQLLNGIYGTQARAHPEVLFVDAWHLFVNPKGRYAAYLRDERGHLQLMREPDKVHLTAAGDDRLARYVVEVAGTGWGLQA